MACGDPRDWQQSYKREEEQIWRVQGTPIENSEKCAGQVAHELNAQALADVIAIAHEHKRREEEQDLEYFQKQMLGDFKDLEYFQKQITNALTIPEEQMAIKNNPSHKHQAHTGGAHSHQLTVSDLPPHDHQCGEMVMDSISNKILVHDGTNFIPTQKEDNINQVDLISEIEALRAEINAMKKDSNNKSCEEPKQSSSANRFDLAMKGV